eukprot:4804247-Amphidinium_carterae.1
MSVCPGHLGTAGRRVAFTRSDSARPEAPSADGGREAHGRLHLESQRTFKQRWLEMPDPTMDGIGVRSKKFLI